MLNFVVQISELEPINLSHKGSLQFKYSDLAASCNAGVPVGSVEREELIKAIEQFNC